jgi:hypothetical protein
VAIRKSRRAAADSATACERELRRHDCRRERAGRPAHLRRTGLRSRWRDACGRRVRLRYQTDGTGQYHNDPNTRVARLHGWAKTDAQGHFEFRTIHPGAYPGRQIAAHIHFHVWGGGYPLQWTPELLFAGDPLLKPEEIRKSEAAGKFGSVRALTTGADGVQHCTFNIRVSNVTNYPPGTLPKP